MPAKDVLLAVVLIILFTWLAAALLAVVGPLGQWELLVILAVVTVGVVVYMMKRRPATKA